ncbi:MAG: hypothetical protein HOW97_25595 [Catenulispora sp.]|nr:hypothetical protein [Catenulispora sp.]
MNIRIEQVGTPAPEPNRRTRRRLPRGLGNARRLAAQIMLRPNDKPSPSRSLSLARRGTSTLALAAAALAVPVLPSTAVAATAPDGMPMAPAPFVRHHLPHGMLFPGPGGVTFQSWAASGWSLDAPPSTVDPRCLVIPHHHRCTPWMYHPDTPIRLAGPGPDAATSADSRPTIEGFRVPHISPRVVGEPDAPDPMSDLPRPEPSPEPQPDESTTLPAAARARPIPVSVVESGTAQGAPQNSAQNSNQGTTPATRATNAVKKPTASPCLRAAYLAGKDRRMLAHLRPAVDAMGVIVNNRHTACAAMVDYLSQSRA